MKCFVNRTHTTRPEFIRVNSGRFVVMNFCHGQFQRSEGYCSLLAVGHKSCQGLILFGRCYSVV